VCVCIGSLFVRLMLGKVNVRSFRDGERLTRKNEYEKFRGRTNIGFLAFVLCRIVVWWWDDAATVPVFVNDMLETIWLTWLFYYYTTLALRENILKGSIGDGHGMAPSLVCSKTPPKSIIRI
jgi:hypothetical protein